ncbi:MAG: hypothetical protein H8D23_01370 [Candidatus Brocadiales bacterium]|nr:hypothetical protein [Candidatus Brocadiales bacterium]
MLSTEELVFYLKKILNDISNPDELYKTINLLIFASLKTTEREILTVVWNYDIVSLEEIQDFLPDVSDIAILDILDSLKQYELIMFLEDKVSGKILYKKSKL